MRAIVVGGSGQIGGWLLKVLAERGHEPVGTYHTVRQPGLVHLDASRLDHAAGWLREQRPEVVFYPAGFTWVDGCERDPRRARSANLDEPLNLARVSAESGARFVYFSTDYVFDGEAGPYDEQAETHPLSAYGRAKLDAERALSDELGEARLIVRTSWVFGPERQGKNFAYQLVKTLGRGQTIDCPSDQESSPSYGPDVAKAVVSLVETGVSGLIHVAGPEVMGRVEFARSIAGAFGLPPAGVVAKTTEALNQEAPRPLKGGLLTPRLDSLLPAAMPRLAESLNDFRVRLALGEGWAALS